MRPETGPSSGGGAAASASASASTCARAAVSSASWRSKTATALRRTFSTARGGDAALAAYLTMAYAWSCASAVSVLLSRCSMANLSALLVMAYSA